MNELIDYLQEHFSKRENPKNAELMAAYMKTSMPFYGIRSPERRFVIKEALKKYPLQNQKEYLETVQKLWSKTHREDKYAAIDIARSYPIFINSSSLPVYEQMIRTGAWWDFVDDIAVHLVGTVLIKDAAIWSIIESWAHDENLWIRRTAIICQNKFKTKTDQERLFKFCLQNADRKDFFMRKAIGWALREYAKVEPQAVFEFICVHKDKLSQLSYKEAGKHLNRA